VDAKSTDVCTGLARDPEDGEVSLLVELEHLGLVDGSDSQTTLDGSDERGTLVESTTEGLKSALDLGLIDLLVKTGNGNVLLTGSLLGLDKTSGTLNADDQATSNLRIKGTTVTSLLYLEDSLNPGDDLFRSGKRISTTGAIIGSRSDIPRDWRG
jgi:hypothetical protein